MTAALEQNLVWYRRLRLVERAFVWLPVSFLYFQSQFGLSGALRLSGFYYLAVVIAEVPSGWLSDRFGRVRTLRLSALWLLVAQVLFVTTESFAVFVLAQTLVAMSFAFRSGTDVALHYDSVEALDRSAEFEPREATIARDAYRVTVVAALVGGALGTVDLRLPFAVAAVVALVQLVIAGQLSEPPRSYSEQRLLSQVGQCLAYLRRPLLGWLFFYVVAQITLEHLSVELGQPYIAELLGESADDLQSAPLFVGVLLAVVALVGSMSAAQAVRLRRSFGLIGALLLLVGVEAAIAMAMAMTVSAWVLPLMALRSVQPAIANVLVPATVSPLVRAEHRATYLSLGSLGGRLGYGMVLLALGTTDDFDTVRHAIGIVALVLLVAVLVTSPIARRDLEVHE
ncbi:MAG: MFS transporter [Acidimicrobiia bacterium]|nr:MFS transporter [Acidimicrobiia bacterium]